jgi:hypothetical protein
MNIAFVYLSMKNQGNDHCSEVYSEHLCAIFYMFSRLLLCNGLLISLLDDSNVAREKA